ncbi:hypothetical protein, partial [Thiolapillus sp.]|uniref:hypothetical protein n=1 Tax=Thiolapillus sp. TaxID=2017437 RepID=UPI003AF6442D
HYHNVISREEKATSTRLTDKIFMKLLSNPKIIKTAPIGLELCSIIQRYEVISKASTKHAFEGSLTHATT